MSSPSTQHQDFNKRAAWRALWALVIGFFMILLDTTIVSTAMPAMMQALQTDITGILWVNSAYLLTFAVPLLVTGRLGDRVGPHKIYLLGLVIFTLASLWCGLAGSLTSLVIARAVQGLGAALISPQSMTLITRIFPYQHRGAAMGLWGAVAGIASLTGPILGGLLVDSIGWQWIFFINVPLGILSFAMVLKFVPRLQAHAHTFDLVGVLLSALAMFCLVFGIQEGDSTNWQPFIGPLGSWHLIGLGIVLLAVFIWWQSHTRKEPLVPLRLFAVRNFSLANVAIVAMGLTVATMTLPMLFYLQQVRELTPTQSALMISPMALVSAAVAPLMGAAVNRYSSRSLALPGFALYGGSMLVYALLMHADTPLWALLIPPFVQGVGAAMIWPSLSLAATRDLTAQDAGAGSGIYNTTRQIGSVLGSALIAVLMESRVAAQIEHSATGSERSVAEAMSLGLGQALLLPAGVALAAVLVVGFLTPAREQSVAAKD
ncbi:DHA2 family efflux MFS transporter permease subunit [Glutamicibacter sp. PS]|uniref:DHA2 family efflux MFS transporter permease subunit n=1 Tax=Glutamicibacter sp. PS TaxID=3075634 RepID=UPI002850D1A4|nr:DHA2 family efflux MFS transporter permease subunit [Glutamicibacter sp. PS]MDR4531912.1 DHA2 family efflux MFS transporter permease subunit [Glutamicibacter sp. PS]